MATKDELTQDERAELEALRAQAKAAADVNEGNVAPDEPTHVALLANGDRYEYSGAHPTHVAIGDTTVPVTGVYPLTV